MKKIGFEQPKEPQVTADEELFLAIIEEMFSIYTMKNADYGNSSNMTYEMYGDVAYAVRINDKMNRINSLLQKGEAQVEDEKLEDTILDMANYCVLWLMEKLK